MIEDLKSTWTSPMTWAELADFCYRMTEKRKRIRESRGIQPPRTRCPRCGSVSRADIQGISIRSTLFMLRKIGIVSESEFKKLDRNWMKYRAEHHLDPFGEVIDGTSPISGDDEPVPCCCA
jgi:hypothetical protein